MESLHYRPKYPSNPHGRRRSFQRFLQRVYKKITGDPANSTQATAEEVEAIQNGTNYTLLSFHDSPIRNHTHFICSVCRNKYDYDVFNSCPIARHLRATDGVFREIPGPCNHCVPAGQEPALQCGIIRCTQCLNEGSMNVLLRIRNQKLESEGYERKDDTWWQMPDVEGRAGRAKWKDVRYGPCDETFLQRRNLKERLRHLGLI